VSDTVDTDAANEAASAGESGRREPEPWASLNSARHAEAFAAKWLDFQCQLLGDDVLCGVVVLGTPDQGPFAPVAVHPQGSLGSPILISAIESAAEKRQTVVAGGIRPASDARARLKVDAVAYPLVVDNQICGAVGIELEQASKEQLAEVVEQLRWGSAWMEAFIRRSRMTSGDRLVTVIKLITTSLHHDRFQMAATAVATELAGMLECERISIGYLRGQHAKVRAVSHSASISAKANIIRAIEAAMDEAIDQQATIIHPPTDNGPPQVIRAHEALVETYGAGHVCTIPMAEGEKILGALVLERTSSEPFDPRTVQLAEHVAALVGPLLDMKRKDDRWLIVKAWDSFMGFWRKLLGPRRTGLKLITAAVVGLILFFTFMDGEFRVTADARLEGSVQRAISAPLAGYIANAKFRAGDIVSKGDVLVSLDERDLYLERLKVGSQRAQYRSEYAQAVADHDRAQAAVLGAQVEQAEAQLELIEEQLSRIRVAAPFDGVVVTGDLSQSLGAPVERGDILFEVAPLEDYRIILSVDERDVGELAEGQTGDLVLSSLPDEPLPIEVTKITPVATAEEGTNFFRVEANLTEPPPELLRPGMEGVGKIGVDQRKLLWIWTYKIVHWVRMSVGHPVQPELVSRCGSEAAPASAHGDPASRIPGTGLVHRAGSTGCPFASFHAGGLSVHRSDGWPAHREPALAHGQRAAGR
jgi:RND family efflux transporter MFP subunit